jgi:hypothetical protein
MSRHDLVFDNARHLSEQYLISAQFFAQDFRQVMLKPHCTQILLGKLILLPLNVAGFFMENG